MDGITINGKHSFYDFDLYIKDRDIGLPERRSVRKSVPYCNGSYDFSALKGELSYSDRVLSYTFDVTGDTLSELEANKSAVYAWLMETQEAEIRDDVCPGVHFVGSLGTITWLPDENGFQGELSVTFQCYPFKIRDFGAVAKLSGKAEINVWLEGVSAVVMAMADGETTVSDGTLSTSLVANTVARLDFALVHGSNVLSQTGSANIVFTYYEEVV